MADVTQRRLENIIRSLKDKKERSKTPGDQVLIEKDLAKWESKLKEYLKKMTRKVESQEPIGKYKSMKLGSLGNDEIKSDENISPEDMNIKEDPALFADEKGIKLSADEERKQRKTEDMSNLNIFQNVLIEQAYEGSTDSELNDLYSYLKYLSSRYMLALNDYHLKLVLNHSLTRDNLRITLNDIELALEKYIRRLKEMKEKNLLLDIKTRTTQKSKMSSEYRSILIRFGLFLKDLDELLTLLLKDHAADGGLILSPEEIVMGTSDDSKSILHGKNIIEALKMLKAFIGNLISYFNFTNVKSFYKE